MNRRTLIITALVLALLAGALTLDLAFRGLAWQFFAHQTGEERPLAQLRGMVELLGNAIRAPLQTAPLAPIQHKHESPYGMNVFLQKEVEEDKIRAMLAMIRDAGFTWLRQEFVWEDIEVDGRGQFTDTRNDYDGDGTPDTIDAWEKYDRIVSLAEEYGLKLLVRLSNPPDWANSAQTKGTFAPPDDLQDYVNFAQAVAERYRGRVSVYQVWNEPNIYPEWGEQFADPIAYTDMLCRTYAALKAVDPQLVVVSAAIAPTISMDGFLGYQDLVYLQAMYDNGAGACFDVLAAQAYGLYSGAYDRRLRPTTVSIARHTYYRALMVANGDAHKPIWLSEASWNAVLSAELPPEQIADYNRFGLSTQDDAARNVPLLYQRAQEEWSWIGGVFYWFFTRPDPFEQGQSFYYFRMVEPDYTPEKPTFTPLPVYSAMQDFITGRTPTLYRGTHQAETWQIGHTGEVLAELEGAQFGTALKSYQSAFTAYGTDVYVRLRDVPHRMIFKRDGEIGGAIMPQDGWAWYKLHDSLLPEAHRFSFEGLSRQYAFDAVLVLDNTWGKVGVPSAVLVALGVVALLALVVNRRR